jgi:cobalt/nickel transport system permease protein
VLAAALAFSAEYVLGGLGDAGPLLVARDMLGVHLLIALGEVGLVTAVVWADRRWAPEPAVLLGGSLGVAVLLAPWANPNPDGLERVTIDRGIASLGHIPDLASPLADYAVAGVAQHQLTVALAGAAGTVAVAALAWGAARLLAAGAPPSDQRLA